MNDCECCECVSVFVCVCDEQRCECSRNEIIKSVGQNFADIEPMLTQ